MLAPARAAAAPIGRLSSIERGHGDLGLLLATINLVGGPYVRRKLPVRGFTKSA